MQLKPTKEAEEVDSSFMDDEIGTATIEEQGNLLAYFAMAFDKPVSTHEVGEGFTFLSGSELQLSDESGFQNQEPEAVENLGMRIYIYQVSESFGLVKCSAGVPAIETKEFTLRLHIVEPSVKHFINFTKQDLVIFLVYLSGFT